MSTYLHSATQNVAAVETGKWPWKKYVKDMKVAPSQCFSQPPKLPENKFRVGHLIRARDKQGYIPCLARVIKVCNYFVKYEFCLKEDTFQFWVVCDDERIEPLDNANPNLKYDTRGCVAPTGLNPSRYLPQCEQYIKDYVDDIAPRECFKMFKLKVQQNMFEIGQMLLAYDEREDSNGILFPAMITAKEGHHLWLSFPGWSKGADIKLNYYSRCLFSFEYAVENKLLSYEPKEQPMGEKKGKKIKEEVEDDGYEAAAGTGPTKRLSSKSAKQASAKRTRSKEIQQNKSPLKGAAKNKMPTNSAGRNKEAAASSSQNQEEKPKLSPGNKKASPRQRTAARKEIELGVTSKVQNLLQKAVAESSQKTTKYEQLAKRNYSTTKVPAAPTPLSKVSNPQSGSFDIFVESQPEDGPPQPSLRVRRASTPYPRAEPAEHEHSPPAMFERVQPAVRIRPPSEPQLEQQRSQPDNVLPQPRPANHFQAARAGVEPPVKRFRVQPVSGSGIQFKSSTTVQASNMPHFQPAQSSSSSTRATKYFVKVAEPASVQAPQVATTRVFKQPGVPGITAAEIGSQPTQPRRQTVLLPVRQQQPPQPVTVAQQRIEPRPIQPRVLQPRPAEPQPVQPQVAEQPQVFQPRLILPRADLQNGRVDMRNTRIIRLPNTSNIQRPNIGNVPNVILIDGNNEPIVYAPLHYANQDPPEPVQLMREAPMFRPVVEQPPPRTAEPPPTNMYAQNDLPEVIELSDDEPEPADHDDEPVQDSVPQQREPIPAEQVEERSVVVERLQPIPRSFANVRTTQAAPRRPETSAASRILSASQEEAIQQAVRNNTVGGSLYHTPRPPIVTTTAVAPTHHFILMKRPAQRSEEHVQQKASPTKNPAHKTNGSSLFRNPTQAQAQQSTSTGILRNPKQYNILRAKSSQNARTSSTHSGETGSGRPSEESWSTTSPDTTDEMEPPRKKKEAQPEQKTTRFQIPKNDDLIPENNWQLQINVACYAGPYIDQNRLKELQSSMTLQNHSIALYNAVQTIIDCTSCPERALGLLRTVPAGTEDSFVIRVEDSSYECNIPMLSSPIHSYLYLKEFLHRLNACPKLIGLANMGCIDCSGPVTLGQRKRQVCQYPNGKIILNETEGVFVESFGKCPTLKEVAAKFASLHPNLENFFMSHNIGFEFLHMLDDDVLADVLSNLSDSVLTQLSIKGTEIRDEVLQQLPAVLNVASASSSFRF